MIETDYICRSRIDSPGQWSSKVLYQCSTLVDFKSDSSLVVKQLDIYIRVDTFFIRKNQVWNLKDILFLTLNTLQVLLQQGHQMKILHLYRIGLFFLLGDTTLDGSHLIERDTEWSGEGLDRSKTVWILWFLHILGMQACTQGHTCSLNLTVTGVVGSRPKCSVVSRNISFLLKCRQQNNKRKQQPWSLQG